MCEKNDVVYREAIGNDAFGLLTHIASVGAETDNLSYNQNTFNISEERERRFIERFEKSQIDAMFVALVGELVVGNAIVERNRIARYKHRAEISITVLKEFWGRGIGSHLMQMMIDFAKETGVEILQLEVRGDNARAISLYKRYGFSRVGTFENFFKIGSEYYSADLMILNLKKI